MWRGFGEGRPSGQKTKRTRRIRRVASWQKQEREQRLPSKSSRLISARAIVFSSLAYPRTDGLLCIVKILVRGAHNDKYQISRAVFRGFFRIRFSTNRIFISRFDISFFSFFFFSYSFEFRRRENTIMFTISRAPILQRI